MQKIFICGSSLWQLIQQGHYDEKYLDFSEQESFTDVY